MNNQTSDITDIQHPGYYLQSLDFIYHLKPEKKPGSDHTQASCQIKNDVHEHHPYGLKKSCSPDENGRASTSSSQISNARAIELGYFAKTPKRSMLSFLKKSAFSPEICRLHATPALFFGSSGCGQEGVFQTMAIDALKNSEGLIYIESIDALYDYKHYNIICTYLTSCHKEHELYHLNFSNACENTHSIDLLNPLISHPEVFKSFLGSSVSHILHAISLSCQQNNCLIDAYNLEAMTMLPNLIKWAKSDTFPSATELIINYLKSIQYSILLDTDITALNTQLHADNFLKVSQNIQNLIEFEDSGALSKNPHICLIDVLTHQKTLVISTPTPYTTSSHYDNVILGLLIANIAVADKIASNAHNNNIMIQDYHLVHANSFYEGMLDHFKPNARWFFGVQISNFSTLAPLCAISSTIVAFQLDDPYHFVTNVLRYSCPVEDRTCFDLKDMRVLEAYVLQKPNMLLHESIDKINTGSFKKISLFCHNFDGLKISTLYRHSVF